MSIAALFRSLSEPMFGEEEVSKSVPVALGHTTDHAIHAQASESTLNARGFATAAQIEAGNYPKGHVKINGLDISIENPQGSTRRSKPGVEPKWESQITDAHYGYIRGTLGRDGDQLDVFLAPRTGTDWAGTVYVVDQVDQDTDRFDEHKVLLGFANKAAAIAAYRANYPRGWKVGEVRSMSLEEFKRKMATSEALQRMFGTQQPRQEDLLPFLLRTNQQFEKAGELQKPLIESGSKEAFQENLRTEIAAGKPRDQALAIDYSEQRKAGGGNGRRHVPKFKSRRKRRIM